MSIRRVSGFTLIEMIIAIVIIAVGLAGVLAAFNTVVRSSSDPLAHKQMLALAEEMMEEVMLKPYVAPAGLPDVIAACDRSSASSIAPYNGYAQSPCTIDGTPLGAPLNGYAVGVTVLPTAMAAPVSGTGAAIAAANASLVTVTVTHVASGQTVTLRGWRANYAANLP